MFVPAGNQGYFTAMLFGGRNVSAVGMDDTWLFFSINSTWQLCSKSSSALSYPSGRWGHVQRRYNTTHALIFGGLSGLVPVQDTLWLVGLNANGYDVKWTPITLAPGSPSPVPRGLAIFVSFSQHPRGTASSLVPRNGSDYTNTVMVAGGWIPFSADPLHETYVGELSSDLSQVSWTVRSTETPRIAGAMHASFINSEGNPAVLVYKGLKNASMIATIATVSECVYDVYRVVDDVDCCCCCCCIVGGFFFCFFFKSSLSLMLLLLLIFLFFFSFLLFVSSLCLGFFFPCFQFTSFPELFALPRALE